MGPQAELISLRYAMSDLLTCDRSEVVQGIFRYVQTQHPVARFLLRVTDRTMRTPLPAVIALLGGMTCVVRLGHRGGAGASAEVVSVARRDNERRAIDPLKALLPELAWSEFVFDWSRSPASMPDLARLAGRSPRRLTRLMRRLDRRFEFFPLLRVTELFACYWRYYQVFRRRRFSLAVLSSHTSPYGIAFNLVARKFGVPVVLISHGLPLVPMVRLAYDLALLHSEAARKIYVRAGCPMQQVIILGRRRHYAPMPDGPLPARSTVGVFLAKNVREDGLLAVLRALESSAHVARVLVRPHPTNLCVKLQRRLAALQPRVVLSAGRLLDEDLKECDIVLAGNSSVLVEAVTAGKPSAYVPRLDTGPHDLNGFIELGLVPDLVDCSEFRPDAIRLFYKRPVWAGVLREFANVDEDEADVAQRVRMAMLSLAGRRSGAHPESTTTSSSP